MEAYHGGIVRSLLYGNRLANTPYNATVADVIDAISNLRNEADGTSDSDQSIVTATANGEQATLVPADGNGLVFTRTPSQVCIPPQSSCMQVCTARGLDLMTPSIQLLQHKHALSLHYSSKVRAWDLQQTQHSVDYVVFPRIAWIT